MSGQSAIDHKDSGAALLVFSVIASLVALAGMLGTYAAIKEGSISIPASVNANQARQGAVAGTMAMAQMLTQQYCGVPGVTQCATPASVTAADTSAQAVQSMTVSQAISIPYQAGASGVPVNVTAASASVDTNLQTIVHANGAYGQGAQGLEAVLRLYSTNAIPPSYPYNLYISGKATLNGSFNQTGGTIKIGTNDSKNGALKINGETSGLSVTYNLPTQAFPAIIQSSLEQYATLILTTDSAGNPEILIPATASTWASAFGVSAGTYTVLQTSNPGDVPLSTVESAFGLSFTGGTSSSLPVWSINSTTNPSVSDKNGGLNGFVYATTDVSVLDTGYLTVVSQHSIDVQAGTDIYPFAYYSQGSNAVCGYDSNVCSGTPLEPLLQLRGLSLVSGTDAYTGYGIIFQPGSEIINGSIASLGEIYVHGGGDANHTINGMIVADAGLGGSSGASLLSQGNFTTSSLSKAAQQAGFGGAVQYFSIRRMRWCDHAPCQ
ncbi:hypothetical protein JKG47_17910 [Acidithiobacillus sp. MC6.1]|nr:hypothetical protein [Acidithiobacillus sp. MC6.1]